MKGIYQYKNQVNKKSYIGQSTDLTQRYKSHKSAYTNPSNQEYNSPLHRAFRKYGYHNFSYTILFQASEVDTCFLNSLEIQMIAKFDSLVPKGYNIEAGGKNAPKPKTETQKRKMMEAHARLSYEEVVFLRDAYRERKSPTQIYKNFYKDKMHFNSFLNIWGGARYAFIMPEVFQKGRQTRLTKDIVLEIRKTREEQNLSYSNLSRLFKIPKSTIADIITKKTWKNI